MPGKVYTATGDDGYTGLLGNERVPKYDPRPEAYGTLDEATSVMGLARATLNSERNRNWLLESQRHLYCIMTELASTPETAKTFQCLGAKEVEWLEARTDAITAEIALPREFIVPGDSFPSATLDVARAVVRRAERLVARLYHEGLVANQHILRYLNRLSSLLFVMARHEEALTGVNRVTLAKKV
ncbi:MAG: cob(I)yrinic acid a,c-diamide adenosyltransferase [Acidobacteria bacterium]|nr:cob(I)yrinic acid a,c-diamide adenosyltransferase [Acidobacteriota bacterium]